jgi:release factor glutamine methyltransferase
MKLRELLAESEFAGIKDDHGCKYLQANMLDCSIPEIPFKLDADLDQEQENTFRNWLSRFIDHEPPQYIVGRSWFQGLELEVNNSVLIPRPETEGLVELALSFLFTGVKVLDIGTGSGAVAIALKHNYPAALVTATDISPAAMQTAERNAARHSCDVSFIEADLFPPDSASFDLIVSNPPYISTSEYERLDESIRCFEPANALLAGEDGLFVIRSILKEAQKHLTDRGILILEHGAGQQAQIIEIATELGYNKIQGHKDLTGRDRYVVLHKPDLPR